VVASTAEEEKKRGRTGATATTWVCRQWSTIRLGAGHTGNDAIVEQGKKKGTGCVWRGERGNERKCHAPLSKIRWS